MAAMTQETYKDIYQQQTGDAFPQDPSVQLQKAFGCLMVLMVQFLVQGLFSPCLDLYLCRYLEPLGCR